MLLAIKERNFENLEELASLKNQEEFRSLLHNIYLRISKKVVEPVTDTIKNTSEGITKTITETYFKNIKASEDINGKIL